MAVDSKKETMDSKLKLPKKLSEVTSKLTGAFSSKLFPSNKKVDQTP